MFEFFLACKIDEFECANQYDTPCIPIEYVCDDWVDCLDGSDESEDCPPPPPSKWLVSSPKNNLKPD